MQNRGQEVASGLVFVGCFVGFRFSGFRVLVSSRDLEQIKGFGCSLTLDPCFEFPKQTCIVEQGQG